MPDKIKVEAGDHLIIRDASEENRILKEGNVVKIMDIGGTSYKRIHCDGLFLIDVEK